MLRYVHTMSSVERFRHSRVKSWQPWVTLQCFIVGHVLVSAGLQIWAHLVFIFERYRNPKLEETNLLLLSSLSYQTVVTGMTWLSNFWTWPNPVGLVDRRTFFIEATNSLLEYRSVSKKTLDSRLSVRFTGQKTSHVPKKTVLLSTFNLSWRTVLQTLKLGQTQLRPQLVSKPHAKQALIITL